MTRNTMLQVLCTGALTIGLAACSAEETPTGAGTRPMVVAETPTAGDEATAPRTEAPVIERLELVPPDVMQGQEIRVVADVSDPDGGPLRMTFTWSRNGQVVATTKQPTMTFHELEKGDSVELEAVASDGRNESAPVRVRASVGNRQPLLTGLGLEPADNLRGNMTVTATPEAEDADNDRLSYRYEWSVNGAVRGDERSFSTEGLRRGDVVSLRVWADDGVTESKPYKVETTLGNTPPVVRSDGERPVAGVYQHQFLAEDADGDRNLRFYLEQGPAGMKIDGISGLLVWEPADGQGGRHEVIVGVKDSAGDGSTFSFAVNVSTEAQPPAAPAP